MAKYFFYRDCPDVSRSGEALPIEKSGGASAINYFDVKGVRWYQQGD